MVIGITGGVGSGKSEVLRFLENEYHGAVIQTDQVAHELMKPGNMNYQGIVKAFGSGILAQDGTIDREKLGEIVFQDQRKLEQLNRLTHKNVDAAIQKKIREIKEQQPDRLIVSESALLVGAPYEKLFDQLWYIYASMPVRKERLRASRGYSDEKLFQIADRQSDEEAYKKAADYVIDNSGDFQVTKAQIRQIFLEA